MAEFFEMGGYAAFVWPSWIVAVAVIIAITISSYGHDRKIKSETDRLEAALKASKKDQSNG